MNPKMVLGLIEVARDSDRRPLGWLDDNLDEFLMEWWIEHQVFGLSREEEETVNKWMRVWLDWRIHRGTNG